MGTDIHGVFQAKSGGRWVDVKTRYEFDRDYTLFSWLAGVRGPDINTISEPRGLPDDFEMNGDRHHMDEHNGIWMGHHSYSWLCDDEILNNVPAYIEKSGIISKSDFYKWDHESIPNEHVWYLGDENAVIDNQDNVKFSTTHVRVSWKESGSEVFKYFIDEVRRLKDIHGDVRFVFGFDS